MAEPTTLSSWAAALAAALAARGLRAEPLLIRAGLDPALLSRPGARYPTRGMTRFWELAVQTSDAALPLSVPRHLNAGSLHALGPSLRASRNLEDALLRMARYSRLVTDAADLLLEIDTRQLRVTYQAPPHALPLADAAYVAFMATAVDLMRKLSQGDPGLRECELRMPAPPDPAPYARFFGHMPRFGASHYRLTFARAPLLAPLAGSDAATTHTLDRVAAAYLAGFDAQPVSQRLRQRLMERLPSGEPTRAQLAAALHLTPRTLLRRLATEGTNWKTMLNEVRRDLALSYLRQGHSAMEITYLLGFADPGNFNRAFRRWTGQPPARWRRTQHPQAEGA